MGAETGHHHRGDTTPSGPHGKGMPEVMDPGDNVGCLADPSGGHQFPERGSQVCVDQAGADGGDEEARRARRQLQQPVRSFA